jgi:hypothetical protein
MSKLMVSYSNSAKLIDINNDETLNALKLKLSKFFNIPPNEILIHLGQKMFSKESDSKKLSELGIRRAIKISRNHTPADQC